SHLTLNNSDVVANGADVDGGDPSAGGGLAILASPQTYVLIANTIVAANYSSADGFSNELSGPIDTATNSAFGSAVTILDDHDSIIGGAVLPGDAINAFGIDYLPSDNGGTVSTLQRLASSILIDAGSSGAL